MGERFPLGNAYPSFPGTFGLSLTSPIDASIVTTTAPIATMIVASIYLKEPVTGKKVIGIFLGSIGALTLILLSLIHI